MNALKVMATLVEIERIVGKGDPIAMRAMIAEAQEGVLRLQEQLMVALEHNGMLREQLEGYGESSSPSLLMTRERWYN